MGFVHCLRCMQERNLLASKSESPFVGVCAASSENLLANPAPICYNEYVRAAVVEWQTP